MLVRKAVDGWAIWCPGCCHAHFFDDKRWTFDGDHEKPTFTPSHDHVGMNGRCHMNLIKGIIYFDGRDTQHALAGKAVPLPNFP